MCHTTPFPDSLSGTLDFCQQTDYYQTMRTKDLPKPTLDDLASELITLRSYIIGLAGKDSEGEYRPEFVERILNASKEPATESFTSAHDFLSRLRTA